MRPLIRLLPVMLLAAAAGSQSPRRAALPPASEPDTWPIRSLAVEGNRYFRTETILKLTGLEIGQRAGRTAFEAARDRLLASGAFETVAFRYGPAPSGDGFAVVFEVAEIQQIYPFRFVNIPVAEEELRAWLKKTQPLYADKIPGTEEMIARYAAAIEQYLKQKNLGEAIKGQLTADRPEELYIMFYPAGALPVIAEVDFTGTDAVPAEMLRQAIHGVAIGSRYTEPRFRVLLDTTVRPVYEARGRVRVSFPKIDTQPAPGDVNGLRVTVQVDEGASYNFGEIRVEGTLSMNASLLEAAGLKSGDVANFQEVQKAIQRINAAMRREGYLRVQTAPERTVHDTDKTVDVVLRVSPGPQFKFGKLSIEGLDINGEYEIRRIWGLKEGEIFDDSYPDYFLQQVRERGVFDNLQKALSKVAVHEDTLTADVTLIFNPEPPKKPPGTR